MKLAIPAATLVLLGTMAVDTLAVPLRWNVDIQGLQATSSSIFNPEPVSSLLDVHGYFDADDRNGDGVIAKDEVLALEPMVDVIYTTPGADNLLSFSYSPATGLSYKVDGYHYTVDFGVSAARISDIASTWYAWTPDTTTTITGPVPVPEPSTVALLLAGCAVLDAGSRWQRAPRHRRLHPG